LGKKIGGKTITHENFTILPARNVHHYSLWVKHIESIFPPFGAVYTGSSVVARLFKDDGKHKIVPIKKLHSKVSATEIRRRIISDENWEELVPEEVAKLIKKWDAVGRLKEIK
jgi:nicotinamide-nucleotide adenylyltransferase